MCCSMWFECEENETFLSSSLFKMELKAVESPCFSSTDDAFDKACHLCSQVFFLKAEYCDHLSTVHGLRTTKKKQRPLKPKEDIEDEFILYKTSYVNRSHLRSELHSGGVAVLSEVIPTEKVDRVVTKLWSTLKYLTSDWIVPLDIDDESTYRSLFQLYPHNSMLIQSHGLGQAEFMWDIRADEGVAEVFAELWGCTVHELIVSQDALSIHLPPEVTGKGWKCFDKFHTDQSFLTSEMTTFQGLVNLYDTNVGDATTMFLKGSHKLHSEFFHAHKDKFTFPESHFTLIDKDDVQWFLDRGCSKEMLLCKRGDLVLWDSRTMHCGAEPLRGRDRPNTRATIYTCMTPRAMASAEVLQQRFEVFRNGDVCTHCPYRFNVFNKRPRKFYDRGDPPALRSIPAPQLSDFAKSLL